jgi:hypothetical protein
MDASGAGECHFQETDLSRIAGRRLGNILKHVEESLSALFVRLGDVDNLVAGD